MRQITISEGRLAQLLLQTTIKTQTKPKRNFQADVTFALTPFGVSSKTYSQQVYFTYCDDANVVNRIGKRLG